MGKQCPDCNKLAGLETQDPEDVELEIEGSEVQARFRVVRNSACCGTEMKEANFEPEMDLADKHAAVLKAHDGEGHELSIEETGVELIERSEGRGRGTRSFYGATVSFDVTCSCQEEPILSESISDDCQASHFDELT